MESTRAAILRRRKLRALPAGSTAFFLAGLALATDRKDHPFQCVATDGGVETRKRLTHPGLSPPSYSIPYRSERPLRSWYGKGPIVEGRQGGEQVSILRYPAGYRTTVAPTRRARTIEHGASIA